MNRRSKSVPFLAVALLLIALVAAASPASAQRYRHSRGGTRWGISLSFGSPHYYSGYYDDCYPYDGYYDGFSLGYYSRPVYRTYVYPSYRHRYYYDDDYRYYRHDRGRHRGWYKHRW